LKFGDVVTCVASLTVILVLVDVPIAMVLVPALGFDLGPTVSSAVSMLLSALIGGYIFAGKIWEEARMAAIAKIIVFSAVLIVFYVANIPALADWAPTVKEAYLEAHPGETLSTSEWLAVEQMVLVQVIFINVIFVLVFGFVGLYVGSMLRRPAKSGK